MGMRLEFLLVYYLFVGVLLVGGLFGLDYVQDCLEAQSGAVVAKSYKAPESGLVGSCGEVYRLEIFDGSKKAVVSVPESVWGAGRGWRLVRQEDGDGLEGGRVRGF